MLLPREIEVQVVASTWPRKKSVPQALLNAPPTETVDVATVLNLIGVLTTPVLSGTASLSEFWAFLRYSFALTANPELRLTPEYGTLDPHQKSILSDDFGMGFPMHWLAAKLNLIGICDGRYFIEHHLTNYGGVYHGGSAKRGPRKAPDFIALDRHGKFHVIECKGTQSSRAVRDQQLIHRPRNKPASGGVIQKKTVRFPPSLAGERLACGLFIAASEGPASHLKIVDPDDPPQLIVKEKDPRPSTEGVTRGLMAKILRTSGLRDLSDAAAFPRRRVIIGREFAEEEPEGLSELRQERARAELAQRGRTPAFEARGRRFIGRRAKVRFPGALILDGEAYQGVKIRQGVDAAKFDEFSALAFDSAALSNDMASELLGDFKSGADRGRAWLEIGTAFFSDVQFLKTV